MQRLDRLLTESVSKMTNVRSGMERACKAAAGGRDDGTDDGICKYMTVIRASGYIDKYIDSRGHQRGGRLDVGQNRDSVERIRT